MIEIGEVTRGLTRELFIVTNNQFKYHPVNDLSVWEVSRYLRWKIEDCFRHLSLIYGEIRWGLFRDSPFY